MTDRTAHRLRTVAGVMVAMFGVVLAFIWLTGPRPVCMRLGSQPSLSSYHPSKSSLM